MPWCAPPTRSRSSPAKSKRSHFGEILSSLTNLKPTGETNVAAALTQLSGSTARNVLPPEATANINMRVAPFETVEEAVARARALAEQVAREAGMPGCITVEIADGVSQEPAPVSPHDDPTFDYVRRCVAGVYPEAGCTPYVQSSCSDARAMNEASEHVYRMAGYIYSKTARELIHAANERIPVADYKRGLEFYVAFVSNLDKLDA